MKESQSEHVRYDKQRNSPSNPPRARILWVFMFVILGVFVYLFARAYQVSSNMEAEMRRQSDETDTLAKQFESNAEKLARIEPLDVNSATLEQLDLLPQVSPKTAESIIENRPYESLDQLIRANGIGKVRLALIRKHLIVRPEAEEKQTNKE